MSRRHRIPRGALLVPFALTLALGATPACRRAESQAAAAVPARRDPGRQETPMKPTYSKSGYDVTPLSRQEVAALAARLSPEAYRITQKAGTEPPFCGNLLDNKKQGVYVCAVCGLPLFSSDTKFHSGTGWPSFFAPVDPAHLLRILDSSHGMERTEIACARCRAHLGHVFEDGPPPTGERHCLNSASLVFHAKGEQLPPESQPVKTEVAYFAGGCFWGVEHQLERGPGVLDAVSGYAQGHVARPTYKEVCSDTTGAAETVKVVFDPRRISYRRLLEAFFALHDPTQVDRQGPDVGSQYRSGVFTTSEEQQREAVAFVAALANDRRFAGRRIATRVEPLTSFWPAEEYHQDYIAKNGAICHTANPW